MSHFYPRTTRISSWQKWIWNINMQVKAINGKKDLRKAVSVNEPMHFRRNNWLLEANQGSEKLCKKHCETYNLLSKKLNAIQCFIEICLQSTLVKIPLGNFSSHRSQEAKIWKIPVTWWLCNAMVVYEIYRQEAQMRILYMNQFFEEIRWVALLVLFTDLFLHIYLISWWKTILFILSLTVQKFAAKKEKIVTNAEF